MFKYIVRRLIMAIPVILGVSFLSFIIIQAAPGDFLDQFRMNPSYSQETITQLEIKFGFNENILVQYGKWLVQVLQGNFGHSFQYHQPVYNIIWGRLGATLLLSITTLILSWSIGISLGIFAARRQYKLGDQVASVVALIGLSIPNFFFALLFLYMSSKTGWFPIGGMTAINHSEMGFFQQIGDYLWHVAGPAITLGFSALAGVMRQMRGQFLDQLGMDYVEFAKAKGMPEKVVVYKHALRNAINPLITMFGYTLSSLLGGAVLTEQIFSWPGMGRLTIQALNSQDLYLVMASLLLSSMMLVIGNLSADLLLAAVDPRVRKRFQ